MSTRQEFLRLLWEKTIDPWGQGSWIDAFIAEARVRPNGSFADAGQALVNLLAQGADRGELSVVARAVAYEVVFQVLYKLGNPGVDGGKVFGLYESLLSADPSGREGRPLARKQADPG